MTGLRKRSIACTTLNTARLIAIGVVGLMLAVAPGCTGGSKAPSPDATRTAGSPTPVALSLDRRTANMLVHLFADERWDAFASYFDAAMQKTVPASKLQSVWAQVTSDLGAYRKHREATDFRKGIYEVIEIPLVFEHGTALMRAAFAPSGLVAGLYVTPS